MDEPKYDINELAAKWQNGTITPEEKTYYEKWYGSFDDSTTTVFQSPDEIGDRIYSTLKKRLRPVKRLLIYRIAAAASILFLISVGVYLYYHHKQERETIATQVHDIAPGGNKAVLTLSNGQKVSLTDAKNGHIAQQGGASISKIQSGEIVYTVNKTTPSEFNYNTITTPKGGQYRAYLSDGTFIMLDAASSIRYPAQFTGTERKVEITGQVYFEVKHNAKMPFKVTVKGQTIEDLGTNFNISAYDDDPSIKTTLVSGSISITKNDQTVTLQPGQVAVTKANTAGIQVKQINVEDAIAWKNGLFRFNRTDVRSVMRQLARWYDVEVEYDGTMPKKVLTGEMYRSVNASEALQLLKYADVQFRIEDKKIIVTP